VKPAEVKCRDVACRVLTTRNNETPPYPPSKGEKAPLTPLGGGNSPFPLAPICNRCDNTKARFAKPRQRGLVTLCELCGKKIKPQSSQRFYTKFTKK